MKSTKRFFCWLRGYHVVDGAGFFKFRYDQSGYCADCGKVGNGIRDEDGE